MKRSVLSITMNPSVDKTIELYQLIPYGLNRVKSFRLDPGGKGINVGRVLRNFGVDVLLTGMIAGHQGKTLMDQLNVSGIPHDFIEVEGETRTNLKIVDESVNKVTEINEQGFVVTPQQAEVFFEKLESMAAQFEIVVLSGSLPPGASVDFYAQCIRIAKQQGAKVLLDAEGPVLFEGLHALPYAIKPNLQELGTLFHTEFNTVRQVAEAAKKLTEQGIALVIVSMGPEGAVFVDKDNIYKADSWDIPVKSTVGAGDAMVASLAYSLLRNEPLYDLARFSTSAGTVTVSKSGTQFCALEEVQESIGKVFIREIEL